MAELHEEAFNLQSVLQSKAKELRNYPRKEAQTRISYRLKKATGAFRGSLTGEGFVKNFSNGGILFDSAQSFNRGSLLQLTEIEENVEIPIPTDQVIRILRSEKNGENSYQIAAEFI